MKNCGTASGFSASASDQQGNTVVVWTDHEHRSNTAQGIIDNGDIKATTFTAIGNQWDWIVPIANSDLQEYAPAVALDDVGNAVVAWTETSVNGDENVRARRFDPNGYALGPAFAVAARPGVREHQPKVGMDWDGNFVVSYTIEREIGVSIFSMSGTLKQSFTVGAPPSMWGTPNHSHSSSIVSAPDGGFVLAYQSDSDADPTKNAITLVQVGADAWDVPLGDAHYVVHHWGPDDYPGSRAMSPSVSLDIHANPVLVGLFKGSQDSTWNLVGIQGQWFARPDQSVLINVGDINQVPVVASDPTSGNYAVAYLHQGRAQIAEVTHPAGTPMVTQAALDFAMDRSSPSVTVNGDHRFLVTYTSPDVSTTYGSDIIGQFGQLGSLPGSPVVLSRADHVLTVNGTGGGDTIIIRTTSWGGLEVAVNSRSFILAWSFGWGGVQVNGFGGQDTIHVENIDEDTRYVAIDGGTDDDIINISPVARSLKVLSRFGFEELSAKLIIDGGTGTNSLNIYDSGSREMPEGSSYVLEDGVLTSEDMDAQVSYSNAANVSLFTNPSISFSNAITVRGHIADSSLAVYGGGASDQLTIDFSAGNPIPTRGITFDGGAGSNSVVLGNDGFQYVTATVNGTASGSLNFGARSLVPGSPLPTIMYSNVQSITDLGVAPSGLASIRYLMFIGQSGSGICNIVDGPTVNGVQTTQINGGGTFAALNFARRNYVTVNCPSTHSTITLNNPHATPGLSSLAVNGGGHNNWVDVFSTASGVRTTINTGAGTDAVVVGASLDAIQGALTLNGQSSGGDFLAIIDQGAAAGHSYTFTPTTLTRDGAALVTFGTFETINLDGTKYDDRLSMRQGLPTAVMALGMGAGNNRIYAPNTSNNWRIEGDRQARLNSRYRITGIGSLDAGSDADRFVFLPGGFIPGSISGGSGANTLDYSNYKVGVTVDLGAYTSGLSGYATGVGSNVWSIQIIIGSQYSDTLRGNIFGQVLVGRGGIDYLYAGAGRSVLIGGTGRDLIQGGAADDLLIGGFTSFDSNPTALHQIFVEWQSADSYADRVKYLSGIVVDSSHYGGPVLRRSGTSPTVFDDSLGDTIDGLAGSNWTVPS